MNLSRLLNVGEDVILVEDIWAWWFECIENVLFLDIVGGEIARCADEYHHSDTKRIGIIVTTCPVETLVREKALSFAFLAWDEMLGLLHAAHKKLLFNLFL